MQIFTSRYANKALAQASQAAIGISRGTPRWKLAYQVQGRAAELFPSLEMLGMDEDDFLVAYEKQLKGLGVDKIRAAMEKASGGRDCVLLCFEDVVHDDELFCHRRMFADWWEKHTGERVNELEVVPSVAVGSLSS